MAKTDSTSYTGGFQVQLARQDIGPVFTDKLKLGAGHLCPVANEIRSYRPGSAGSSAEINELLEYSDFVKMAGILANPDLRMVNIIGGGALELGYLSVYMNRRISDSAIVTFGPSGLNAIMLQLFNSPYEFMLWWINQIASPASEPLQLQLPGQMTLESMVLFLHAVDAFRRVSYINLLNHVTTAQPAIPFQDFFTSMNACLQAKDTRWLIPTFFGIVPNITQFAFNPVPEHLQPLINAGILSTAKDQQTGQDVYLFGDAFKVVAGAFFKTWINSIGFETSVLLPGGGIQNIDCGFIAPTILANHLIHLQAAQGGQCMAKHSALTMDDLFNALLTLLEKAIHTQQPAMDAAEIIPPDVYVEQSIFPEPEPVTPPMPQQPPIQTSQPQSQPAVMFCSNCGHKLAPDAVFCPNCGQRMN